jgi:hypothetical protein
MMDQSSGSNHFLLLRLVLYAWRYSRTATLSAAYRALIFFIQPVLILGI